MTKRHLDEHALDAQRTAVGHVVDSNGQHALAYHDFTADEISIFRDELLAWFAANQRSMPWRKPFDPSASAEERAQRAYEVWMSEIMLHQTQVATVIPYFNRFLEKWPTIFALADASIEVRTHNR